MTELEINIGGFRLKLNGWAATGAAIAVMYAAVILIVLAVRFLVSL